MRRFNLKPEIFLVILIFSLFEAKTLFGQQPTFSWAHVNDSKYGVVRESCFKTDKAGNSYNIGIHQGMVNLDPNDTNIIIQETGIFIQKLDPSGNLVWLKEFNQQSKKAYEHVYFNNLAVDDTGNIYIIGDFSDTIDFAPDSAVYNLISNNIKQVFILKLNSSGNLVWVNNFGTIPYNAGCDIKIDGSGDVVATGIFSDTVDFDPSVGIYQLISKGPRDIFAAKFNTSGQLIWAQHVDGLGYECSSNLDIDSYGNIYLSATYGLVLYAKLNSNGINIWTKYIDGSNTNYPLTIRVDSIGNIYSAIFISPFLDSVDVDPGLSTHYLYSSDNKYNYILKLDSAGNYQWIQPLIETPVKFSVSAGNFTLDNEGNLIITGCYRDWADLDCSGDSLIVNSNGGPSDVFFKKMDSSGNIIWGKTLGGYSSESTKSISTDMNGDIFVTGAWGGLVDFNPDSGINTLQASYQGDQFILKTDSNGAYLWAKKNGGFSNRKDISASALDSNGNIYITGIFDGTVDFDSGPGVFNLSCIGVHDFYIEKNDASGNLIWVKRIVTKRYCAPTAIITDHSNNVIITGNFSDTVDFDPGPGSYYLYKVGNSYNTNFILKLDCNGNFVWVVAYGGGVLSNRTITIDSHNNIITAGTFLTTTDFDPGPGVYYLTVTQCNNDGYILKLDSDGLFMWVKALTTTSGISDNYCNSIVTDKNDNIYTAGSFYNSVDFNPGGGTFILTSSGNADAFILKLDNNGNYIWAQGYGNIHDDQSFSAGVDTSGNIYCAGIFHNSISFGLGSPLIAQGSWDTFIVKKNATGITQWAKRIGNFQNDWVSSLDLDLAGNVYLTGTFIKTVDFDPGPGQRKLNSNGSGDIYIEKLNTIGDYVWAKSFGATDNDDGQTILVDGNGGIYATGSFRDSADVDPNAGSNYIYTSNEGNFGKYLLKWNDCGATSVTIDTTVCKQFKIGNTTYSQSGNYYKNLQNTAGCDSLIIVNLTVLNSYIPVTINAIACSSYVSPSGNYIWTTSGIYHDTLTNAIGCDSAITINLSIGNTSSSQNVSACNSYTSPSGNYTWNISGVYLDTLLTAFGCDSVLIINLTIGTTNTYSTITTNACNNFGSPSGNYNWTVSGVYNDTIPNAAGCDSIITFNLTVNHDNTCIDSITTCNSYTWIDGNIYAASNNTATFILTNASGCDSTITLNLTINTADTLVTQNGIILTANASGSIYSWLDCDNNYAVIPGQTGQAFTSMSNGNYALAITENGCTDTSSCYNVTGVGVSENNFENNLIITPNPTIGQITIVNSKIIDNIVITNPLSQIVFLSKPKSKNLVLEIKANGIYYITITSSDQISTNKIIVNK